MQVRRSRHCKRASEGTLPVAAISAAAALPLVSGSDAVCLFTSKAIRLHNSLPHNPIDRIGSTKYTHCNFTESLQYRLRAKRSESRLTPGNDNKRCREAESRSRFTAAWARRRVRAAACTKDRDVCEPGEPRTQRRHQGRVTFYTVFGLSFQYRDDGLNLNQFYVFFCANASRLGAVSSRFFPLLMLMFQTPELQRYRSVGLFLAERFMRERGQDSSRGCFSYLA